MLNILKKLMAQRNFNSVDFAILKTSMMLASLDGDVSSAELDSFKSLAADCRGYNPDSFAKLWEDALRSAGYLLIQSKMLAADELVALFVREAQIEFVAEVASSVTEDSKRAFEFLTAMAESDGDFSEIERKAIAALTEAVKIRREKLVTALYPRGMQGIDLSARS